MNDFVVSIEAHPESSPELFVGVTLNPVTEIRGDSS
jgi:hypothetical protein